MPPPQAEIERLVASALQEDWGGRGDITSQAVINPNDKASAVMRARDAGTLAGLPFAQSAFLQTDGGLAMTFHKQDGARLVAGDNILTIQGAARSLLTAERVALNFVAHLTGIATQTAKLVDLVAHTQARICDTRKTTPGLRVAEKYAVRAGGGVNHRFGLYDAILIKDNHIAVAGSIATAFDAARMAGHMVSVQIEVDTLDQLGEALALGADKVLLDNMSPAQLAEAVKLVDGRAITEASGRVSAHNIVAIAEAGVDLISVGALTHSAPSLDVGLDFNLA